jgi:xylulokinase
MALLGLDLGTSACKGMAISEEGNEIAHARREYPLSFPAPGRVELDSNLVWQAVREVIQALAVEARQEYDPIRAICLSVSGDEALPIDSNGMALYPCIIAMDARSIGIAQWLEREFGRERMYSITGLPLHAMHPLTRLMWLRMYEPQVFARTARMLCWEEFVALRLGVEPITDFSVASRTMAFDIRERDWAADLLSIADIPRSLFPEARPSGTAIGTVPVSVAHELGLEGKVTVVTGGFDQPMAALGSGQLSPGDAVVGTGTWEALTILAESPALSGDMLQAGYAFGCHVVNDLYFCLASNAGGGSLLRWFRDTLGREEVEQSRSSGVDAFDLIIQQATVRPTGLLVLPHFEGSYNPWMDPHSTGAIVGLSLSTTRGDLVKAILEGITFELRENIERVESAGPGVRELRATGGGAKSATWLQLKADITGKPVITVNVKEAGCFAAACLAGVGVGAFASIEEPIKNLVHPTEAFEPRLPVKAEYDEIFASYHMLYSALKPVNHSMVQVAATTEGRTPV